MFPERRNGVHSRHPLRRQRRRQQSWKRTHGTSDFCPALTRCQLRMLPDVLEVIQARVRDLSTLEARDQFLGAQLAKDLDDDATQLLACRNTAGIGREARVSRE